MEDRQYRVAAIPFDEGVTEREPRRGVDGKGARGGWGGGCRGRGGQNEGSRSWGRSRARENILNALFLL